VPRALRAANLGPREGHRVRWCPRTLAHQQEKPERAVRSVTRSSPQGFDRARQVDVDGSGLPEPEPGDDDRALEEFTAIRQRGACLCFPYDNSSPSDASVDQTEPRDAAVSAGQEPSDRPLSERASRRGNRWARMPPARASWWPGGSDPRTAPARGIRHAAECQSCRSGCRLG
jgi:hypothetical protein